MHAWLAFRQPGLKVGNCHLRVSGEVVEANQATSTQSTDAHQQVRPEVALISRLRRHGLVRTFLHREVLAAAVGSIEVSEESSQAALAAYCKQNGLEGGEEALRSHLRDLGLGPADLRWQIELPIRIQRYCEEHFLGKAEARFLERKHMLDQVVYSLVRVRDAFLARELYLQILNGEASFADVAAEHGEGPEKTTFGVIGPRPLAQGHPLLVEKLRSAEPGKVMEPFRIDDWWLVARLEELRSADFNQQMANRMASELFDDWINELVTRKLRELSAQAEASQ